MSDPVVEELLEKGARAEFNDRALDSNWDEIAEWQKFKLRKAFAAGLDAVFPGWREGITRTREPVLFGEQLRIRQITTICGPWVPVEEGTDG